MRKLIWTMVGVVWLAALGGGFWILWNYETTSGRAAEAPTAWPAGTQVPRPQGIATLVLSMHPQCPCSRASVEELNKLMAHCRDKLQVTVLMVRPEGTSENWDKTALWRSAAAIPGVKVITDDGGVESRRFGAATSGQALLYSAEGKLWFAGGITESRGHGGDNAGESTIMAIVLHQIQAPPQHFAQTPVYGCPLFSDTPTQITDGGN